MQVPMYYMSEAQSTLNEEAMRSLFMHRALNHELPGKKSKSRMASCNLKTLSRRRGSGSTSFANAIESILLATFLQTFAVPHIVETSPPPIEAN